MILERNYIFFIIGVALHLKPLYKSGGLVGDFRSCHRQIFEIKAC